MSSTTGSVIFLTTPSALDKLWVGAIIARVRSEPTCAVGSAGLRTGFTLAGDTPFAAVARRPFIVYITLL